MNREEAIKTLKENSCNICSFLAKDMESCSIAYCDNRAAIRTLEQETKESKDIHLPLYKVCDRIEPGTDGNAYRLSISNGKEFEQQSSEDCISRANALRVAKNEYLRGWHNALCKALSEKYSIHCEEGNLSVIQEETITGLGLSMDCAVGKDVESYMSTIPSVIPKGVTVTDFADKCRECGKMRITCKTVTLTPFEIKMMQMSLYHQWFRMTDDNGEAINCEQKSADCVFDLMNRFEKLRAEVEQEEKE